MLQVGIHENVVLSNDTVIKEDGSLVIAFETATDAVVDFMSALEGGESLAKDKVTLLQFKLKSTDWQGKTLSFTDITASFNKFRGILVDILTVYMPADKAKATLGVQAVAFAGLGITNENMPTKLAQDSVLEAIYNNLAKAFIAAIVPYQNKDKVRVMLQRSSKAKHYPAIPAGKVPQVWIESMQIPKSASKVQWSAYQIKEGYNDGTPVATDSEDTSKAEAVFAPAPVFGAPSPAVIPAFQGVVANEPVTAPVPVMDAPTIDPFATNMGTSFTQS